MSEQAASPEASASAPSKPSWLRRHRVPLMMLVPLFGLAALGWLYLTSGRYQQTDDAYVQAARVPISTSITGRIIEMRVKENEPVEAGEIMFVLDKANFQADVRAAEAALAAACTQVSSLKATYRARLASQRSAEQSLAFARSEADRQSALALEGIASDQDLDAARHDALEAETTLEAARQATAAALADLGGSPDTAVEDHPLVRQAAARLDRARLAESYTNVIAPQAGVVTRVDQVQVGSYVNAGQTLFWLIAGEPWVEANFKEDQLENMRVGQTAMVRVDAYSGEEIEARVASFSPGTGAVFAALPAQNATGNWVKVVQRLPVRLEFVDPPPELALRAGLSVRARVDTQSDVPEAERHGPLPSSLRDLFQ